MIRNYEYGLLDPTVNAELVNEQIRAAHRYRNALTEIERDRRAAVAAVLVGHPDTEALAADVARLDAEREQARQSILSTRQHTRDRSETPAMRDKVTGLSAALKAARLALKTAKHGLRDDPAVTAAIDAVDAHAARRVRAARAATTAHWGSYLLQEQAMDAARKSKTPPRFVPFTGEGRVSVQLQGGLELAELWGSDTQLVILPVSSDAHDEGKPRGVRRRAQRTLLRMRVQSTDKGKPVWAEWPMILHRPIPEGARIKVATVSKRRRDCRTWFWRLLLTLDIPDAHRPAGPDAGAIALNLGWRQTDSEAIRAGYVVSDDGKVDHEVTVMRSTIDRVEKSEAIRSVRDKNLDQMRAALVPWLRDHEASLPEWFVERTILARPQRPQQQLGAPPAETIPRTPQSQLGVLAAETTSATPQEQPGATPSWTTNERGLTPQEQLGALPAETTPINDDRRRVWHIGQWRAAARYRALAFAWRAARWDGDADGYALIEAWRYRDEHLERYESNMRRGALLDRREHYRILAAKLAQQYRTLIVDDFDLRTFQASPAPEENRVEFATAKRNQRHAAGSELRAVLMNAFGEGRIERVSSNNVSRTCHACNHLNQWDQTVRLHICGGCGVTWDQDVNACKNLLARWRERVRAEAAGGIARVDNSSDRKESRSDRLRRSRRKAATPGVLAE